MLIVFVFIKTILAEDSTVIRGEIVKQLPHLVDENDKLGVRFSQLKELLHRLYFLSIYIYPNKYYTSTWIRTNQLTIMLFCVMLVYSVEKKQSEETKKEKKKSHPKKKKCL